MADLISTDETWGTVRGKLNRVKMHAVVRSLIQSRRTPFGYMTSPPTFSQQTTASLNSNTGGACSHPILDGLVTPGLEAGFYASYGGGYRLANTSLTDGSRTFGGLGRLRFVLPSAAAFEVVTRYSNGYAFNLIVEEDGVRRIAYSSRQADIPVDTGPRYGKFDFGASVTTYEAISDQITSFVAAGSGYSSGDLITLAGGSLTTAAVLRVVQVSSGAVVKCAVATAGVYSAFPSGTLTQGSTTGSGTGFQIAASAIVWGALATTRKARKIELQWSGNFALAGLNIATGEPVLPWPVASSLPRVLFWGDSQMAGTFLRHAADHIPSQIARRLGFDDCYAVQAAGGTGWNKDNGTAARWSNAYRIADAVAFAPDVMIIVGSQNDTDDASTQAAVTATLDALAAALPTCLFVGIGSVKSTGSVYTKAGWLAASVYGTRALYVDNVTDPWLSGSGKAGSETGSGNMDIALSSDGAHLDTDGKTLFATLAAEHVALALMALTA